MLPLLALVASECGPPRCTEPLTTGATFDAEYMQLDASAGCQHAVPSASELRTVLKGSWLRERANTPSEQCGVLIGVSGEVNKNSIAWNRELHVTKFCSSRG